MKYPLLPITFLITVVLGVQLASAEIRYAQNFTINCIKEGILEVEVSPTISDSEKPFRYVLVRRGMELPSNVNKDSDTKVISIPVKKVITMSTTYVACIDAIGELESIIGVSNFQYINNSSLRDRIDASLIREVGTGASANTETIVSLNPDVVFAMAINSPIHDIHPIMERFGIPSVLSASWQEKTPLGRTEWIKFFAAFYDKMEEAEQYFTEIETRYNKLLEVTQNGGQKPTVLCNVPRGNSWYIPCGESYLSNALRDAGADYLWKNTKSSGSIPMDFESVYERGSQADFWIHIHQARSLNELNKYDPRFSSFKAVRNGNVFNNTLRLNPDGGNDIWEYGFVRPDKVLADLIAIFHPDLLPEHEFTFYQKIE